GTPGRPRERRSRRRSAWGLAWAARSAAAPKDRKAPMENFTLEDATNLYGIDGWGAGYFAIGNEGNLVVKPTRDDTLKIDIKAAVDGLVAKGVHTPLLLRFPQVLETQVTDLCSS